jgi:hypothetical protein
MANAGAAITNTGKTHPTTVVPRIGRNASPIGTAASTGSTSIATEPSASATRNQAREGRTAEQRVTTSGYEKQLETNRAAWEALKASSISKMDDLNQRLRHHRSAIRALNGLLEGVSFMQTYAEGPSSAAVEIVRKAIFEANGRLLRTLTNPLHGGVGMPRNQDGTYGGLAAFVKEGIVIKLEPAERSELMKIVGTLKSVGCEFKGPDRGPIWAALEAAYASDIATSKIEAAAAAAVVTA